MNAEPSSEEILALLAPLPQRAQPPRLGILHLLLWTAGTALLLTLVKPLHDQEWISFRGNRLEQTVIACWCIILGPAATSWVLYVMRRKQKNFWPLDPGELLLLLLGASTILDLILFHLVLSDKYGGITVGFVVAIMLVRPTLYAVAYGRYRRIPLWRMFFALNILSIWGCWVFRPLPLPEAINPLTHLVLLVAIYSDHALEIQRNWLHWLGVLSYLTLGIFYGCLGLLVSWG